MVDPRNGFMGPKDDIGAFLTDDQVMGADREAGIGGPSMNRRQFAKYKRGLKKRARKSSWGNRLFGRFK